MSAKESKNKYTVQWVTSGEEKTHGTFNTFDEAMQSIFDWWKKHDYKPPYIRQWKSMRDDKEITHIDYGLHSAFYQIVKERD
nr:MAG TPA: Protein damX division, peptidoglycan binding domain [Caudoviricetes sp.]